MADVISPATGRRYGVARVCQVWEVPRSTFYAAQQAGAAAAGPKPSPARRGPKPAISDEDLLAAIRADLARSPWSGEGHRGQGLGPAAGDGRHPGLAQAGAAADARAQPAFATPRPHAAGDVAREAHHHRGAEPDVGHRRQCAAASGVRDGGRPPAIGLQEQVANHRKRRGSKARVVSVTEKAPRGVRWETGRRTTVNCRSSVESAQMTSKPVSDVAPGSVWPIPAYGPGGVRHRGSAILFQALTLNCGNLRWRWQAKGTSPQGEADNSDAPPRDGAVRSSIETAVMAVERRDGVIRQAGGINWETRRNPA